MTTNSKPHAAVAPQLHPAVGVDRVTGFPVCEHGDDTDACQLAASARPVDFAGYKRVHRSSDFGVCPQCGGRRGAHTYTCESE